MIHHIIIITMATPTDISKGHFSVHRLDKNWVPSFPLPPPASVSQHETVAPSEKNGCFPCFFSIFFLWTFHSVPWKEKLRIHVFAVCSQQIFGLPNCHRCKLPLARWVDVRPRPTACRARLHLLSVALQVILHDIWLQHKGLPSSKNHHWWF